MSTSVIAPKKTNEMIVIGENIDNGLQTFNQRKADLEALKLKADGLKIVDITDKKTINEVSTVRKELKTARVEIEKEGKAMRDQLTKINKNIIARENELVAIIEPTEKELLAQEKWVEDEKARIAKEADDAEKARIQVRIDKLAAFGFTIDYTTIVAIDEPTFEGVLANAEIEFNKEQQRKADEAEAARLEAEKIVAERAELEKLRAAQAEAQRVIDENNARIKREQEEKEAAIAAEEKRQQAERDRIEKEKQAAIEAKKRAEELEQARKEAAEKARLQAIEDARIEAAKKAEDDRLAEEAKERAAALAPDKVKLQTLLTTIKEINMPVVTDEQSQVIINEVVVLLNKVQDHIIKKIKAL